MLTSKLDVTVKVKNPSGLHVRPATYIVRLLQNFQSKVTLTYKGESINARSIMSIMILAAPKNAKIVVDIEGIDASQVLEKLVEAFDTQFGEGVSR